jgi:1-acyl-sn-glycerol-3-phosphate acyltransferase
MKLIAFLYRFMLSLRYRIKISGEDILLNQTPQVFLPNHQALIDPQIILAFFYPYKPISPVITEKYTQIPGLQWFFKQIGSIPIPDLDKKNHKTNFINQLIQFSLDTLNRNHNLLLYPSGMLCRQNKEIIGNKQSAYLLTKALPDDVKIIGIRINGLWGSMWSCAANGQTPSLTTCFLIGFIKLASHLFFFYPKKEVTIELVDLTKELKAHSAQTRREYNLFLENFYNNRIISLQHISPNQ